MKNKTLRIILDLVLIIVGIIFLIIGINDAYNLYKDSKSNDNIMFKKSYNSVKQDNIYKYIKLQEIDKILDNEKGILLIGKTTDPWMHILVSPVNDILEGEIEKIYYLELDNIDETSETFIDLNKRLDKLNSPCIVIFNKGQLLTVLNKEDIFNPDYEGAPIDYYDDKRIDELKEKLIKITEIN